MDIPGIAMTRNPFMKQQDKEKAACVLLVQHSIKAYANLVALYSRLLNTFLFLFLSLAQRAAMLWNYTQ